MDSRGGLFFVLQAGVFIHQEADSLGDKRSFSLFATAAAQAG